MPARATETRPRFSIVTAVYNVARYLDAFIASVDAQDFPAARVEIIAVDDGSTDDSLARLQTWAGRRSGVQVLTKPNGGQASARNLGLQHVRGEWVTFPDPDDVLARDYLSRVDAFLADHPETPMVGASRHILDDTSGALTHNHPLKAHFRGRDRLRYLDEWPDHFYGSAPAAFFRTERVRALDLRFPEEVRPNFEDGHFCCRYLLSHDRPAVGFVGSAIYQYRKRRDGSSTLGGSLADPDRYTKVLRHGYLALLRQASAGREWPPDWLQNLILYELSWYFTFQDRPAGTRSAAVGPVADEFHALMAEITAHLRPELINDFALRPMRPTWRFIMANAYRDEHWRQPYGLLDRYDRQQRLMRLTYHFTGPPPAESFASGEVPVEPAAAKIRPIRYHGRALLWERIVWLPARRALTVRLDGRPLDLTPRLPRRASFTISPKVVQQAHAPTPAAPGNPRKNRSSRRPLRDRLVVRLARSAVVRRLFGNAWVLMDRIHDADDSGERLFRYLRQRRRKINAWFVVEGGTADYRRLRRSGYRRVVPHGSLLWKLLMLNCRHLISSHADLPIMRPPAILRLGSPTWRFTFLQHGVIKDDLSTWLNPKRIDLFVVSSPQEYASIVGDDSTYVFTAKEVKLTGLPRFDRLREIGQRVTEEHQDLILVTPTWRHWLVPPLEAGSQRRTVVEEFFRSDFARQWQALLRSPELADLARRQGLRIGFLPHPNLQGALHRLELPQHVEALSYDGSDVQELFARAAVVVTDYSSIAFNAAYIDRPVVYFQFDEERMQGGEHVGRRGYFDYRRDGFGPVADDLDEAIQAIGDVVAFGRRPQPWYQRRIEETFPDRDGRCCARVTDAILASGRRWRTSGAPRVNDRDDAFARAPHELERALRAGPVVR